MADRYNIRNVAQKEIYDSYMGILRISPNENDNKQIIDDPSEILNTIDSEIQLSDSDGNKLPLTFIPKQFDDLINIKSYIKGNIYICNKFQSKSTIKVNGELSFFNGINDESSNKLIYPNSSPFEKQYFNNNDNGDVGVVIKYEDDVLPPRKKFIQDELYKKSLKDYDEIEQSQYVKINDKIITTGNKDNDEVPVIQTHDYILGHYQGDTTVTNNKKETKLSWIRIDEAIWNCLDDILKGGIRHTKGRYKELGASKNNSLVQTLGFEKNYEEKAPILGTSIPSGLIVYHAMQFQRYWFHRCRQALVPCQMYDKKINISFNGMEQLKNYKNEKITPCSKFTKGFIHSLSKDFLLCNGEKVCFENFPNMNLTNSDFFDITKTTYVEDPNTNVKKLNPENPKSSLEALANSIEISANNSESHYIKLPNLFSLNETVGRFIRGDNEISDNNNKNTPLWSYNYRFPKEDKHYHLMFSDVQGGYDPKQIRKNGANQYANIYHCTNTRKGNWQFIQSWFYDKVLFTNKTHSYDFPDAFYTNDQLPNRSSTNAPFNVADTTKGKGYAKNYEKDEQFLKYCLGGVWEDNRFYDNYTPIPNVGLMLFNAGIYNKITPTSFNALTSPNLIKYGSALKQANGEADNPYKYQGTLKIIEDNLDTFYYVDAQKNKHYLNQANQTENGESKINLDRRMMMAIKMNQAEGNIPISYVGNAQYVNYYAFSIKRRESGLKKKKRVTKEYTRSNIAGYKLMSPKGSNDNDSYFCMTSIPYQNPQYLGYGDITKCKIEFPALHEKQEIKQLDTSMMSDDELWANKSVTVDLSQMNVGNTINFGKKPRLIKSKIPSPNFLNLIPLIKI